MATEHPPASLHRSLNSMQSVPWYCNGNKLLLNFALMGVTFSINHAAITTVLGLSTKSKVITSHEASVSNGTLYVFYTLSALTFASGLTQAMGSKKALSCGLFLYCFYVASYFVSFFVNEGTARWFIIVIGSVVGGCAAGWLWTAQGAFFARTCQLYNDATNSNPLETTSKIGGLFAFVYVSMEVILKALGTFIVPDSCKNDPHCAGSRNLYLILTMCATISAFLMLFVRELPSEDADSAGTEPKEKTELFSVRKILLAGKLLVSNKKMLCLAPLNLTFGLISALINTYANGELLGGAIGKGNKYAYFVIAVLPLTACVLSLVFGYIARWVGKLALMVTGATCYFALCVWVLNFDVSVGYAIIALYVTAGVGRAIFEGTNKAVFADFFPNDKEAAFANIIVQSGFSASIAFFLFPSFSGKTIATICIPFTVLSVACLFIAFHVHKQEKERQPLLGA